MGAAVVPCIDPGRQSLDSMQRKEHRLTNDIIIKSSLNWPRETQVALRVIIHLAIFGV